MSSITFRVIRSEDDLVHYGILGQKWGIRRYQNYDGSYTRKGLERYRKSEKEYNEAAERYKVAKKSGTRKEIREARANKKLTKDTMNENYNKLKNDMKADEGKKLYQSGKTITSNNAALKLVASVPIVAAFSRIKAIESGKSFSTKFGNVSAADMTTVAGIGAEVAASLFALKRKSENRKLRAYYEH